MVWPCTSTKMPTPTRNTTMVQTSLWIRWTAILLTCIIITRPRGWMMVVPVHLVSIQVVNIKVFLLPPLRLSNDSINTNRNRSRIIISLTVVSTNGTAAMQRNHLVDSRATKLLDYRGLQMQQTTIMMTIIRIKHQVVETSPKVLQSRMYPQLQITATTVLNHDIIVHTKQQQISARFVLQHIHTYASSSHTINQHVLIKPHHRHKDNVSLSLSVSSHKWPTSVSAWHTKLERGE